MRDDARDLESLEATRRSIRAVQQVVRALESLSQAQRGPADAVAADASVYLDWIDELIDDLAGPAAPAVGGGELSVILGPERGFCGPLAHTLARQVPREGELGIVGTRLAEVLEEDASAAARIRFRLPGASAVDELPDVAARLARAVLEHGVSGRVLLWHPRSAQSRLHAVRLLSGPRPLAPASRLETWSDPAVVLRAAVSESVAGRLIVALAETLRSEVLARLLAAGAARQACERRLEELRREVLSVRQEQTTREILEIVASHLTAMGNGAGPR